MSTGETIERSAVVVENEVFKKQTKKIKSKKISASNTATYAKMYETQIKKKKKETKNTNKKKRSPIRTIGRILFGSYDNIVGQ